MAFNKAKALHEAEKLVSQGKVSQAIRQYLHILQNDPSDLTLLNTVGDLYVRERNLADALRLFHKLADAYVHEGFTVKAIAIYRKIAKLDSASIEPVLKLAELYQVQGLGREAREQLMQAVEYYRKRSQPDKALEVFHKVIQLDPENIPARTRLADFCEEMNQKEEAAQVHIGTAEILLRRGDLVLASTHLEKAADLHPQDERIPLLRARVALRSQKPAEAVAILTRVPAVFSKAEARQMLRDAYLATNNIEGARDLSLEAFRANPADFSPIASFVMLCCDRQEFDSALSPLAEIADDLIRESKTGPLMECLRQIWTKSPQHIPTLEFIQKVCEQTGDEVGLPDVFEALGRAYFEAGDFEKAERIYEKLCLREPGNSHYQGLLRQALEEQGKEYQGPQPSEIAIEEPTVSVERVETPEETAPPQAAPSEADQAAVREAIDNSDLFARYGLVDKALSELEHALKIFPDHVDILTRIVEISRKGRPDRAAQAAGRLARILAEQGDHAGSARFAEVAAQLGEERVQPGPIEASSTEVPPVVEVSEPSPPPDEESPAGAPVWEVEAGPDLPFGGTIEEDAGAEASSPPTAAELPFELPSPAAPEPAQASESAPVLSEMEVIDLSDDWEAFAGSASEAPSPHTSAAFNFEEAREEITFYLAQGFIEEAQKIVGNLEEKFPGDPQVVDLRRVLEEKLEAAPGPPSGEETVEPVTIETVSEDWELPSNFGEASSQTPETHSPEEVRETTTADASPPASPPESEAVVETAASVGSEDVLGGLANDLAPSLEGLEDEPALPAAESPPEKAVHGTGPETSPLDELLQEFEESSEDQPAQEDPETHYNLGVAFREMNLLDEAIGEFQRVVRGAGRGNYPLHFLQACSLLALCFMDKKMPAIAAKWYLRALETPGLDDEATLALLYDLGVAYEQAGEVRHALERFTEVCSQNIDFRDVAEKVRLLQQRVS
jgi:tetratricopeptide (TPR) repeat protein